MACAGWGGWGGDSANHPTPRGSTDHHSMVLSVRRTAAKNAKTRACGMLDVLDSVRLLEILVVISFMTFLYHLPALLWEDALKAPVDRNFYDPDAPCHVAIVQLPEDSEAAMVSPPQTTRESHRHHRLSLSP